MGNLPVQFDQMTGLVWPESIEPRVQDSDRKRCDANIQQHTRKISPVQICNDSTKEADLMGIGSRLLLEPELCPEYPLLFQPIAARKGKDKQSGAHDYPAFLPQELQAHGNKWKRAYSPAKKCYSCMTESAKYEQSRTNHSYCAGNGSSFMYAESTPAASCAAPAIDSGCVEQRRSVKCCDEPPKRCMTSEDALSRFQEIWFNTLRTRYRKAVDRSPNIDSIERQLVYLARSNIIQQMCLVVEILFATSSPNDAATPTARATLPYFDSLPECLSQRTPKRIHEDVNFIRVAADLLYDSRTENFNLLLTRVNMRLYEPEIRERTFLPVSIDGGIYNALPDSGSSSNVISEEYALSMGVKIKRRAQNRHVFENACGESFRSLGEAEIEISFPGESRTYLETFSVVKTCAANLVLGEQFLKVTETFTRYRHRLKKLGLAFSKRWKLLYMDGPRRRFGCTIDSRRAFASIDTGSEKDLVSLKYAQSCGWNIDQLPPKKAYVELANGTIKKVAGYVDVPFGVQDDQILAKRFYVLEGLVCDVLLGDNTIYSLDLYNKYASSFVDASTVTSGHYDLHVLHWIDELEDHVQKFLQDPSCAIPTTDDQQILDRSSKLTLWKRLRQKMRPFSTSQRQYQALLAGLTTALDRLDITEQNEEQKAARSMRSLTGDALIKIQTTDEQRRKEHDLKRNRLLEQRKNLLEWRQTNLPVSAV